MWHRVEEDGRLCVFLGSSGFAVKLGWFEFCFFSFFSVLLGRVEGGGFDPGLALEWGKDG